jgi:hypothetical protein
MVQGLWVGLGYAHSMTQHVELLCVLSIYYLNVQGVPKTTVKIKEKRQMINQTVKFRTQRKT